MENKEELEKKICDCGALPEKHMHAENGDFIHLPVKKELNFTTSFEAGYKQGYMRCVEEALKALPEKKECDDLDRDDAHPRGFNSALFQAHDAISKLKENI